VFVLFSKEILEMWQCKMQEKNLYRHMIFVVLMTCRIGEEVIC